MKRCRIPFVAALLALTLLLTSCASGGNAMTEGEAFSETGAVRLTETANLMETLQQVEAAFQDDATATLFDADSAALRAETVESGVRVSAHWGEPARTAYFAVYAESGQMLGAAVAPDGVADWETAIPCDANQASTVKMFRLDAEARPVFPAVAVPVETPEREIALTVSGQRLTVEWEDNASVDALRELVAKQPVTIQMSPYGGFEQVGSLGESLPRKDAQTTTDAGDIVLYQGNQIVMFYGSNSWAYTRLGKISGLSRQELQTLLGGAGVTAILSLAVGKPEEAAANKILAAYFSATGATKGIAAHIAEILDADSYEITPAVPYTSADLNYNDRSARATVEQNDASARPAIAGNVANMEQYDIVFLGYPIWWGQAPRIISTFLESYDFAGKTVVPFCTSGSSPIGTSATNLQPLASGADWKEGRRFSANASRATVEEWANGLNLPKNEETPILDWPEISENGVDEEVLFAQVDRKVLEIIAFEVQTLVQERAEAERANPEIVLSESWTRVFQSERYQRVLDMGQKAVKPLYWIIYKSPNAGLYEYICSAALYNLTGYHFEGENGVLTWSTSKELITRINERVLADRLSPEQP